VAKSVLRAVKENTNLYIIYGLMLYASLIIYVIVVYLPQHLDEIGIKNPFNISIFISITFLAAAITSALFIKIRFALTYLRMIYAALFLWTIGLVGVSLASSLTTLIFFLIIFGIGQGGSSYISSMGR